jgi:GNAT superfamily N-acetyltransferase
MAADPTRHATTRGIHIRDACPDDKAVIADILRNATRAAYRFMAWPHTDKDFDDFVEASMARWDRVRVACQDDDSVVAFMCLEGKLIDQLFVAPDHQRHGIGGSLIDDAKTLCPRGLSIFTFQANKPARAFYEKHGFRPVAFGISEQEGEPDVTYVWAGNATA